MRNACNGDQLSVIGNKRYKFQDDGIITFF